MSNLTENNFGKHIDINLNIEDEDHIDQEELLESINESTASVFSDGPHRDFADQFKLLKLAETLEKTSLDIRIYCRKKWSVQYNTRQVSYTFSNIKLINQL